MVFLEVASCEGCLWPGVSLLVGALSPVNHIGLYRGYFGQEFYCVTQNPVTAVNEMSVD